MKLSDATEIIDEAHRLGFELRRNGNRLHVEGPREAEFGALLTGCDDLRPGSPNQLRNGGKLVQKRGLQ